MNFYKVVLDDKIIDIIENPTWVKQGRNGLIVTCDVSEAAGIVSSDSENILHIKGKSPFSNEYQDVVITDITEDEAEELKVLLNLGADVTDKDTAPEIEWTDEEVEDEPIKDDATLDEVKLRHLAKLSEACQQTIYNGVDVVLSDGVKRHFDLEIEDQLNLLTLSALIANGETNIPYHASDELCEYYSAKDINTIVEAATTFKTYHTSYYNSLKNWVLSMESISEVGNVKYGDVVPAEYCSEVLIGMINSLEGGNNE